MAKLGKCEKCKKLLNWPENVNIDQMRCPCGQKLVIADYGDINRMTVQWFGRVVPIAGQLGAYTVAEAAYDDGKRRRKRR